MARFRDLKVGQTVWIKRGTKDPESFGLSEADIKMYIGLEYLVKQLDPDDKNCTVYAGPCWWPVDWISTTAPKKSVKIPSKTSKPPKASKKPSVLFTAELDGESVAWHLKTLEALLLDLQNQMFEDDAIAKMKFYEVREIEVEFQPAKLVKKS